MLHDHLQVPDLVADQQAETEAVRLKDNTQDHIEASSEAAGQGSEGQTPQSTNCPALPPIFPKVRSLGLGFLHWTSLDKVDYGILFSSFTAFYSYLLFTHMCSATTLAWTMQVAAHGQ